MADFIVVKALCNWNSGDGLCRTWDKLSDGNCTFTKEKEDGTSLSIKLVGDSTSLEDADYILVVNSANHFYPSFGELGKTIFMKMEPCFMDPFWRDVDKDLLKAKIIHGSDHDNINYNILEWHTNKTKDELLDADLSKLKIHNTKISSIISGKAFTDGHKLRIAFALYAQNFIDWDAYGNYGSGNHTWKKYLGAPQYKDDALIPYKYSFACENSFINGYITEKLVDCIVSETLCFYYGAPNVANFINPKAFIQLDLKDWNKSVKIIQDAIADNEWETRLPYIKQEKRRILTKTSMFPRLWSIINKT